MTEVVWVHKSYPARSGIHPWLDKGSLPCVGAPGFTWATALGVRARSGFCLLALASRLPKRTVTSKCDTARRL